MTRAPFEQLPYDEVPDAPRLAHPWSDLRQETLAVSSKHFGDMKVHARSLGQGEPLVLVHGLMTSSYSFRYVFEPLAERFEVIAFDLPGAGRSSAPDVSYGPSELAAFIGEVLRARNVYGARIIGNSMGGYLCMQLALDDPGAMSRLVNLHSPGLVTPRMVALEAAFGLLPGAERVVDWLVRRDPHRWVHGNVHYLDETLKSREEHREYGDPLKTPAGRRAFARYLGDALRASEMERFEARLAALGGEFPVPLALVYARKDPMVPPAVGERMRALLPDASFRWLEDASHFAHVDASARFVEAVMPFLTEEPKRTSGSDAP
jgi:pimeloyl-ACP methyl ester carboxylesterase